MKFIKTKDAQPMGEYKPTSVDAQKKAVDFRLTSMGKRNTIVWHNGNVEMVTDAKLAKLQAAHSWTTDF